MDTMARESEVVGYLHTEEAENIFGAQTVGQDIEYHFENECDETA